MEPTFQKAVIIGCGLIGGSLALALREHECVEQLVAVDPDGACRAAAVQQGVVDQAYETIAEAVPDADLIVFATPVRVTCELLVLLASLPLKPGCIVTDVGGTKQEICETAHRVLPTTVHFIGGHPMAGSEKSGVHAASERLFEHAIYVLTPFVYTDKAAFAKLAQTLERIKAHVLILDPQVHDKVVAAISHVPHLIAAMLVEQVATLTAEDEHGSLYTTLAAGGFRDLTRIASGNSVLWRDIVLSNGRMIRELLGNWQESIDRILAMMDESSGAAMETFFEKAASFRDALPAKSRGAMRSAYDISLDVVDEPGVIGKVGMLIGLHGINLNGISLLESREEEYGQLLLSFPSRREMEAGAHVLLVNGFKVYFRD
ncbi:MAG: prephenate dehydrogenase [Tumebacillaceae bacterium]